MKPTVQRLLGLALACLLLAPAVAAQPILSPLLRPDPGPGNCTPQAPTVAGVAGGGANLVWDDGRLAVLRLDRHTAALAEVRRLGGVGADPDPSVPGIASAAGRFAIGWIDATGVVQAQVFRQSDGSALSAPITLGTSDFGSLPAGSAPPRELALAAGPEGFLAVWTGGAPNAAVFDADGVSRSFGVNPRSEDCDDEDVFGAAAAYDPASDRFAVLWADRGLACITAPPVFRVFARRFDSAGVPLDGDLFEVGSGDTPASTAVAPLEGGAFALAWSGDEGGGLRSLAPDGGLGEVLPLAGGSFVFEVAAVSDPAGNLAVLFTHDAGEVGPRTEVDLAARTFTPQLVPTSAPVIVDSGPVEDGAPIEPAAALTGPGEVTAVWTKEGFVFGGVPLPCSSTDGLRARRLALGGERDLLLQEGRFRVSVEWEDPFNGGSGVGHPLPDSEETGGFWFFEEGNRELFVKVLDATGIDGNFWVFFGSLTNVGFELTVTDQATGVVQVFTNPPFTFASRGETGLFPDVVSVP